MNWRKLLAFGMAAVMTAALVSGCGSDVEGQGVSPDSVSKWYHFAIIFNEDKSCPDTNIVEITDIKESFNVVKELKTAANWNI